VQKRKDIAEARTLIGSRAFIMPSGEARGIDISMQSSHWQMASWSRAVTSASNCSGTGSYYQRRIIRHAPLGQAVVVATQNARIDDDVASGTRAEAPTSATRSIEGAMRHAVSRIREWKFSARGGRLMDSIIRGVEGDVDFHALPMRGTGIGASHADAICSALRWLQDWSWRERLSLYAIGFTRCGPLGSAPRLPILSLTPLIATARQ